MAGTNPISVLVLGAGAIGCAFAAVFRDSGVDVTLVEPVKEARTRAASRIDAQSRAIETAGLRTDGHGSLAIRDAAGPHIERADIVLECGPEQLDTKRKIFAELVAQSAPPAVLASASSAIPISQTVPDADAQRRCLVAHPANPPSVLRIIELVPGAGTAGETVERAESIFRQAGFMPVILRREIEGFVMNRLQGAVLREAYRLVDEGVAGANDIDHVMRLSLGPRWALSGPFETAELNTPGGITAHAARLGPAYKRMGEARGETVDWPPELVAKVERDRRAVLPAPDIPARVQWRTRAVAKLVAARDRIQRDKDG